MLWVTEKMIMWYAAVGNIMLKTYNFEGIYS